MRAEPKHKAGAYVRPLIAAITVAWAIVFTASLPFARTPQADGVAIERRSDAPAGDRLDRIVRILERRTNGGLSREKAREKLAALGPRQIRLLDALARRMLRSDDTAAADLAFFLVAALIVSS